MDTGCSAKSAGAEIKLEYNSHGFPLSAFTGSQAGLNSLHSDMAMATGRRQDGYVPL